jgi:hypothetical protein
MDYNNIRKLLDKYWEGESTLQEETQLRDFFTGKDVPEDLKPFQPLFQFLHLEQDKKLNTDFDKRLIQQLQSSDKPAAKVRTLSFYLMRVAAAGLILFSVYLVSQQMPFKPDKTIVAVEEDMSPEEVYAQTKAALMLVSTKLNKGTEIANNGMSKMAKATSVIK